AEEAGEPASVGSNQYTNPYGESGRGQPSTGNPYAPPAGNPNGSPNGNPYGRSGPQTGAPNQGPPHYGAPPWWTPATGPNVPGGTRPSGPAQPGPQAGPYPGQDATGQQYHEDNRADDDEDGNHQR